MLGGTLTILPWISMSSLGWKPVLPLVGGVGRVGPYQKPTDFSVASVYRDGWVLSLVENEKRRQIGAVQLATTVPWPWMSRLVVITKGVVTSELAEPSGTANDAILKLRLEYESQVGGKWSFAVALTAETTLGMLFMAL